MSTHSVLISLALEGQKSSWHISQAARPGQYLGSSSIDSQSPRHINGISPSISMMQQGGQDQVPDHSLALSTGCWLLRGKDAVRSGTSDCNYTKLMNTYWSCPKTDLCQHHAALLFCFKITFICFEKESCVPQCLCGSQDLTQVVRLGCKCLYWLSHLTGPSAWFYYCLCWVFLFLK